MTGIAGLQSDLAAKWVELLRELVPSAAGVALLVNPTNPYTESEGRGRGLMPRVIWDCRYMLYGRAPPPTSTQQCSTRWPDLEQTHC